MHQRYKCNRSISHDNVQYEIGQVILLDLATAESLLQIDAIKQLDEVESAEIVGALQNTDEQLMVLKEIASSLQQISSGFSAVVLTVSSLMTRLAAANQTSGSNSSQPESPSNADNQAADAANIPATDAPSTDVAVDSASNAVNEPVADTADVTGADVGQESSEQAAGEFGASAWPAATSDEETAAVAKKAKTKKADK